jgi:hypothetical protein
MIKKLAYFKPILWQVVAAILAVGAIFGYRCPAEGCPACRLIGR